MRLIRLYPQNPLAAIAMEAVEKLGEATRFPPHQERPGHWVERQLAHLELAKTALHIANKMREHANQSKTPIPEFVVGDQVMVSNDVLIDPTQKERLKKKWSLKFSGPYTVIEKVSSAAYRIELPKSSRAHNVINVHFLRQYVPNDDTLFPGRTPVDEAQHEGSDQATAVKIEAFKTLGHKDGDRGLYLTHWKDGTTTWVPWQDFVDDDDDTITQVFHDYLISHPTHTVPKLTEYMLNHQEVDLMALQQQVHLSVPPPRCVGIIPTQVSQNVSLAQRRRRRRRRVGLYIRGQAERCKPLHYGLSGLFQ